jgi:RNA polymerase sigma-70 factor (ECF subfamily)
VLNRAVALAEIEGPEAALAAIEPLAADARMRSYQPYWAARGHLLAKIGANADAAEAYRVAIGLSTDEAVRAYLRAKLSGLQQG